MKIYNDIKYCLNNENGSPVIEAIIGIAVALGIGAGLWLLYKFQKPKYKEAGTVFENLGIETVYEY